jgi:hypothetical protein
MTPRPKRPKPDANQRQVVEELRDDGYTVIETAALPGHPEHNPLDLFVLDPAKKVWLQVEVKVSHLEPFTDNERLYLEKYGIWPTPYNLVGGIPIVAATDVIEIKRAFKALEERWKNKCKCKSGKSGATTIRAGNK